MCGRKPWIKKTAAYWFAHKAYSAFIRGWIRQYMKQFENRWLSNSEICLVTIPYMFLPFPISSCFTYFFSRFLSVSHVSPCVSPWFLFLFLRNYGVFTVSFEVIPAGTPLRGCFWTDHTPRRSGLKNFSFLVSFCLRRQV